jgi:pimeloyl-ACP methyl ester carboxylesterase
LVRAYIEGALVNDIASDDFDKLVAPWLTKAGSTSFYRQFAQADEKYTAEVEPLYSEIRCPVKIVWGQDDPWIPLKRGQALHALIRNAEFSMLPGVGHLPQLEAADVVVDQVLRFMEPKLPSQA